MQVSDKDIAEARKIIAEKGVKGLTPISLAKAAKEIGKSLSETLRQLDVIISGEAGGLFPEYKEVARTQSGGK